MKVFTRQFLEQARPTWESDVFTLHCKLHPGTDTDVFVHYRKKTLIVCCKLCERIICEQPIPDEGEIKA